MCACGRNVPTAKIARGALHVIGCSERSGRDKNISFNRIINIIIIHRNKNVQCNINFVVTITNNNMGWKRLFGIIMVNNDSELRERISGLVPAFKSARFGYMVC